MSQYSKMKQSREQWKAKAIERGQAQRYQRKQSARHKATAEHKTKALEAAQARIGELEAQLHQVATRPKVEVVHFALQLFLEARIGFRAVSRVLMLLAPALGIKRAPCPQTVINWVMRLAIVRLDAFTVESVSFEGRGGDFSNRSAGSGIGQLEAEADLID